MQIYSLTSPHTLRMYIGSTASPLDVRHAMHVIKAFYWQTTGKQVYKTTANEVVLAGESVISLIEDCSHLTKQQALKREGYLTSIFPNCVNLNVAGRTRVQWEQDTGRVDSIFCSCCERPIQCRYWRRHALTGKHLKRKNME